jgi:hypothetical protein
LSRPETAAQLAVVEDRHERATADVRVRLRVDLGKPGVADPRLERVTRKRDETRLVFGGDHHIAAAM